MEELITSFSSLGAIGIVAAVLFKNQLETSKADKEYFRSEIKETRELYKQELKADREVYIESIEKITSRIESIEDEVKDIKNTLASREG